MGSFLLQWGRDLGPPGLIFLALNGEGGGGGERGAERGPSPHLTTGINIGFPDGISSLSKKFSTAPFWHWLLVVSFGRIAENNQGTLIMYNGFKALPTLLCSFVHVFGLDSAKNQRFWSVSKQSLNSVIQLLCKNIALEVIYGCGSASINCATFGSNFEVFHVS